MSLYPAGEANSARQISELDLRGYFAGGGRERKGKGGERKRKWTEGMRENTLETNFWLPP